MLRMLNMGSPRGLELVTSTDCEHHACDDYADRWGRRDVSVRATANFAEHNAEQRERALKRRMMAVWVAEVIEFHVK